MFSRGAPPGAAKTSHVGGGDAARAMCRSDSSCSKARRVWKTCVTWGACLGLAAVAAAEAHPTFWCALQNWNQQQAPTGSFLSPRSMSSSLPRIMMHRPALPEILPPHAWGWMLCSSGLSWRHRVSTDSLAPGQRQASTFSLLHFALWSNSCCVLLFPFIHHSSFWFTFVYLEYEFQLILQWKYLLMSMLLLKLSFISMSWMP